MSLRRDGILDTIEVSISLVVFFDGMNIKLQACFSSYANLQALLHKDISYIRHIQETHRNLSIF